MSHALRSRRRQLCRSQPLASQHKTYSQPAQDLQPNQGPDGPLRAQALQSTEVGLVSVTRMRVGGVKGR